MTPVRLFLLTALTMTAFAANSVLNRMALADWGMDAARFGTIRLWAGAVTLVALSYALRGGMRWGGRGRALGVISLLIYIYGFSAAYLSLDAGLGALILFGFVQITMFGGALWGGEAQVACAGQPFQLLLQPLEHGPGACLEKRQQQLGVLLSLMAHHTLDRQHMGF